MIQFVIQGLASNVTVDQIVQQVNSSLPALGVTIIMHSLEDGLTDPFKASLTLELDGSAYDASLVMETGKDHGESVVLCSITPAQDEWDKVLLGEREHSPADDGILYRLKLALKDVLLNLGQTCTWLTDSQSEQWATQLYAEIHKTENLFRSVLTQMMLRLFGTGWWPTVAKSKPINDKLGKRSADYHLTMKDFANVEAQLMNVDTADLADLVDGIERKNGKEIRVHDIWAKYCQKFFGAVDFLTLWRRFAKQRNHVAHNKLLDKQFVGGLLTLSDDLRKALVAAYQALTNYHPTAQEAAEARAYAELLREQWWEEAIAEFCDTFDIDIFDREGIVERFNERFREDVLDPVKERFQGTGIEVKSSEFEDWGEGTALEIVGDGRRLEMKYTLEVFDEQGAESTLRLHVIVHGAEVEEFLVTWQNGSYQENREIGEGVLEPVQAHQDVDFRPDDIIRIVEQFADEVIPKEETDLDS